MPNRPGNPNRDPIAKEFGTWDYANEAAPASAREQALSELDRRIVSGTMAPLGERAPLEDELFPRDWQAEWFGTPSSGPSIPEQQQLRREWTAEVDRAISNGRNASPAQPTPEEMAETMWREFRSAYPQLARDASRVEMAAAKVIEGGGFDPSDRPGFYKRVAKELGDA